MSRLAIFDIDAALTPIEGDRPGGADPRENSSGSAPYYRVKDARNAARAEERAAVEAGAPIPESWNTVVETGLDLLRDQAKDLEVAAWVTEGLVRTEGFAGLRDGLTLIARLVEDQWDHLFPEPDEDGVETKVSPIAGLNGAGATGTLDRPIRNTVLTNGADEAYSYWHYEQASELEKLTDTSRKAARIEDGAITLEAFRKAIADTPVTTVQDTLVTLGECEAALTRLSNALDAAAGADSPSLTALRELVESIAGCLRFTAADRLAVLEIMNLGDEAADPGASTVPSGDASPGGPRARRPGEFTNRDEALAELTQIAMYFRRTEPQSPLSYTLDDAVRRARLTLPDLLKELVQDPEHMRYILLSSGIKAQEEEAE